MAVLYLMKSLARILSPMKAQSLRSFFLGGPSSQALTSFVAFVLRTLREEPVVATLIKKKIKFSSYIGKLRVEQLQSHICMTNGLLIYGEIFAHSLIY